MQNALSENELRELIEKAKQGEPERQFILELEDISDFSNKDWFVRHFDIIYGEAQEIITKTKEQDYGNVLIRNIAIIPITREVVLRIEENSDREEWKKTYFYVFLPEKGWVKVK